MDLSEVYLRQIDEKLKFQIELQEKQIAILAENYFNFRGVLLHCDRCPLT